MAVRVFFIFCLFITNLKMTGQSGFTTIGGANFLGYSRAGVNLTGVEAIYMNQAGLSEVKNYAFDVSAERRFNLEEFTNISIAGARTFKFGTIGLLLSNFGFSEYNEQKFGLAYARKLNKSISLGGQFDLLSYNSENAGTKNLFTFELGMQLQLNKEFSIATHIFSPGNIEVSESTEISTRFRLGLMYKPSSKVFLLAEIDKVIYRSLEYKLGISYQAVKELQIRLGVNPSTEIYSFGAMIAIQDKFKIASAVALNNNLGNTPSVSFQYNN